MPRNVYDDDALMVGGGRRRRRYGSVVEETLKEVRRCTKDGIKINTFMLDQSPALLEFVKMMTKINKGRAFIASPEELGTYVVADYANMRNSVIR
jgi:Ca-activated chloride channel family protein